MEMVYLIKEFQYLADDELIALETAINKQAAFGWKVIFIEYFPNVNPSFYRIWFEKSK
jgi:hypothetical protein